MLRARLVLALMLIGCSSASSPACRVNADCASLQCDPMTFTCIAGSDAAADADMPFVDAGHMPGVDAGPGISAVDSGPAMSTTDDGPSMSAVDAGPGTIDAGPMPGMCVPNDGGTILAAEVPLQAGLHATYRVAEDAGVNTAGASDGGTTVWDFSDAEPGDQDVVIQLQGVAGQWFASSFPTATYAMQLSQTSDLLGVFQVTDSALLLLGVVSPTEGDVSPTSSTPQTNVSYTPPVTVLQFPLSMGDSWSTSSTVTGTALGVPFALYTEDYTMTVDAAGIAITPYASFPVLRVSTGLVKTVGALITATRQFTFVTQCFGPVVSVTSESATFSEPPAEFTTAAELQRLAP